MARPAQLSDLDHGRELRRRSGRARNSPRAIDVLTFEFENIPAQTIEWVRARARSLGRAARSCSSRKTVCAKKSSSPAPGFRSRRFAASRVAADLTARWRRSAGPRF